MNIPIPYFSCVVVTMTFALEKVHSWNQKDFLDEWLHKNNMCLIFFYNITEILLRIRVTQHDYD